MSLVVARALGLVTVQDLGRPGHMHEGVPPGGALVRSLLVTANRTVYNDDDAPAIEVTGRLVIRAETPLVVAVDATPHVLSSGDELVVASGPRRVTYLAVRGGIDAPLVLGGRGTLLCAQLGRILRAGDRLAVAEPGAHLAAIARAGSPMRRPAANVPRGEAAAPPGTVVQPSAGSPPEVQLAGAPVRVIPGPDLEAFSPDALARLTAAAYRVQPSSDRVGTRLAGDRIPRAPDVRELSRPMVRGAIEVPADGLPIVLGPEHPTTGGYPVIGVVAHADLDRLFVTPLGGSVRFTVA